MPCHASQSHGKKTCYPIPISYSDPVLKVVSKRHGGSNGDGQSSDRRPRGGCSIFNFAHQIGVYGVLFVLFCTVNWFDVEGLNIEVTGLRSEVVALLLCAPHFNHRSAPNATLTYILARSMYK